MKIAVTAATGFVGRHLVAELVRRGHAVTVLGRDETLAAGFDWFPSVTFISYDLSAPFPALPPQDALIHLAWPGLPNYDRLFHVEENFPQSYRFIKSAVDAGIGQIMVTGTCLEYGMQEGALAADAATSPVTPYGLGKDMLRKSLEMLRAKTPFILQWPRLFYLYGEGQNPKSVLAQLDRAIERGDETFDMSGGEQLRDYCSAEQLAVKLANLAENKSIQGPVNCGSGRPVSIRALVEGRLRERNVKMTLNLGHYPYPSYEPMAFWGLL